LKLQVKKRIIVSVTTDLISDNRVNRTCLTLVDMGFDVLLVGRLFPGSLPLSSRSYSMKRLKLLFLRGPLFYACFNFRLFCFLLFSKFDLLLSNDLDTLPANFIISKLKKKPMVYDSHEFFTEVPELVDRPRVKRIWEWLEEQIVPQLSHAYTVCDSIANIYTVKYGVSFHVVRNFPLAGMSESGNPEQSRSSEQIIWYQGAVNRGRGLEQAIRAMKYVEGARLVIAGDGDIRHELEKLTAQENLQDRVGFLGRLPIGELARHTPKAALGLSIEEDLGLNYRYALPNKLFDYIQAQVPVLVTDLPEMASIVLKYEVGEVTSSLNPEYLAAIFRDMLTNRKKREVWQQNLIRAAKELTWENEAVKLKEIFEPFK
jgi:glycosyltransferase involved in cell wall biosynthesis